MAIRNAVLFVSSFPFFAATASAQGIVIHNVTVVSPERAQPLTGADVVLDGDRIVGVAAHTAQTHRRTANIVDGTNAGTGVNI